MMRSNGEPLYLHISKILRDEIQNNHAGGDRMEPEGRLADRFGVNRHTLRRAVDDLVQEGLIERRRGRGLFVLGRPLQYALHAKTRITTNLAEMGVKGERTFFQRRIVSATPDLAEALAVRKGRQLAVLDSLVLADDVPLCVSSHYFVHSSHKKVFQDFRDGSLHRFMEETYGLKLKRVSSEIGAQIPASDDAVLLRMPLNQPIMRIKSLNVEVSKETPVEFVVSRFRADRVEFRVQF